MQKVDCSNEDSNFKWSTLSFQGKSWTCFSSSASQGGLKHTQPIQVSNSSEWLFSVVVHLCRLLLFSPLYHGLTLHIQNMFPCHFVHFLHTSAETPINKFVKFLDELHGSIHCSVKIT
jgi:hypothetical protein